MTISQCLNRASAILKQKLPESSRIDAEAILGHCTGMDRAAIYREGPAELAPEMEKDFWQLVARRAGGEPLAYINGRKEFMSLDFSVNPAVLIPRPETELLVEKAVEFLEKTHGYFTGDADHGPVVVDVGTGSGAIAVSLAVMLDSAAVFATDISMEALEVARQNAVRHGLGGRVEFLQGDLLEPFQDISGFKAHLVAANLPYVPSTDIAALMPAVRDYEPHLALDGGVDGLDHYRRLLPSARELLHDRGFLLMEIAPDQVTAVQELLSRGWKVEICRDLAGRERLAVAQKITYKKRKNPVCGQVRQLLRI